MNLRSKWPPVYVAALLVVAAALAFSGSSGGAPEHRIAVPAARDTLPDLVGTWAGTWKDEVYGPEGALTWEITQVRTDLSASGTIDLTQLGMGVEAGTATGSIVGNTLAFDFEAATVGGGSGTIVGGVGSGAGIATEPPVAFGAFTFEGTVTGETIHGTFDFTSPGGGNGWATLTKQSPVEDASWGVLKARYSGGD